jgi:hypothetical protein
VHREQPRTCYLHVAFLHKGLRQMSVAIFLPNNILIAVNVVIIIDCSNHRNVNFLNVHSITVLSKVTLANRAHSTTVNEGWPR